MIGIMINPTWGLTVALLSCSILAAFIFAVYLYLEANANGNANANATGNANANANANPNANNKLQPFLFSGAVFLAVLSLVFIIVFAGQSYNSNETADEVLKTSLLYFIGALVSWIFWKKQASHCCLACIQASRTS